MASLCLEDTKKVACMCFEKQNTNQDSGLQESTWKMSLSFLIFLMMIRKLGVTSKWLPIVVMIPEISLKVF